MQPAQLNDENPRDASTIVVGSSTTDHTTTSRGSTDPDGETATNEANDCLLRKSDVVDGTEAADVEGSSDKAVVDGETTADEAGDCLLQESDVADGFLLE
ncbi:hypothetical protein V6N12_021130 [Hibiscus sabdariffa]